MVARQEKLEKRDKEDTLAEIEIEIGIGIAIAVAITSAESCVYYSPTA